MRKAASFSVLLLFASLTFLISPAVLAQEGRSGLPDSDNDGVPDESDLCPGDPNYAELQLSYLFTLERVAGGGFDQSPLSVALDGTGRIYVSEGNATNRVQVISSDGGFLYYIDGGGSGQFSVPRVAVGPGGRIFVSETYRYRVQVFDENGGWLYSIGGVSGDLFEQPNGIAVDAAGNFYVLDDHQVKIFDNDGTFLRAFGDSSGFGSGPGQFHAPHGIHVDEVGRIYVADTTNDRVQVFTSSGAFLFEFGVDGTGDGEFDSPRDVTAGGYIFVSDRQNDRVQGFDAQGGFLGSFAGSGQPQGEFDRPWGLVFDPATSRLYVGDSSIYAGRVQVMEVSPPDTDADGIPDCEDPCPEDPDNDGDGYGMLGQCPPGPADCNDDSSDCNVDCIDSDGDTLMVCAGDCDDSNPHCLSDCTDADGDGYCVEVDCDDGAAGCSTVCVDEDEDGVSVCAGDCDDQAPYCAADCTNADGDYHCADQDCDDTNPYCSCSCVDNDQDGWCYAWDHPTCDDFGLVDCDDTDSRCRTWADCDDWDGDMVRACSDCEPNDGSSWYPPAEVTGVEMGHVGGNPGTTTLTWAPANPPGGWNVRYDVIRAIVPWLFVGDSADCIETETAETTADDSGPMPGEGYFFSYLVRARHGCQGTAGTDSEGGPRAVKDCN